MILPQLVSAIFLREEFKKAFLLCYIIIEMKWNVQITFYNIQNLRHLKFLKIGLLNCNTKTEKWKKTSVELCEYSKMMFCVVSTQIKKQKILGILKTLHVHYKTLLPLLTKVATILIAWLLIRLFCFSNFCKWNHSLSTVLLNTVCYTHPLLLIY